MALYERLEKDLVDARLRRDHVALDSLGLFKSEVVLASKEPGAGGRIDDALVVRVARREVKRRDEAAEAYRNAGRGPQAAKEEAEAQVLRGFLPAALSPAELEAEVRAVIDELNPSGPGAFGQIMKAAGARLASRAEGGEIAAVAKRLLAG